MKQVFVVSDDEGPLAVFTDEGSALEYADFIDPDENLEVFVEEVPLDLEPEKWLDF